MVEVAGRIGRINRTPVLTLWAAVVAERLGFDQPTALTLGQAVAGISAHAKGVSLGIIEPRPELVRERGEQLADGRALARRPAGPGGAGGAHPRRPASLDKGKPGDPARIERYSPASSRTGLRTRGPP